MYLFYLKVEPIGYESEFVSISLILQAVRPYSSLLHERNLSYSCISRLLVVGIKHGLYLCDWLNELSWFTIGVTSPHYLRCTPVED